MPSATTINKMALSEAQWIPKRRNYRLEVSERLSSVHPEETLNHPLKPTLVSSVSVTKSLASSSKSAVVKDDKVSAVPLDPLSLFASEVSNSDPLSRAISENKAPLSAISNSLERRDSTQSSNEPEAVQVGSFVPWSLRRASILSKYTTSEKLSIITVLMTPEDKKEVAAKAGPTTVADKVKTRLEQLDDFEEGSTQETLNLSQQEYVERIEELGQTLSFAWKQDQRVKSLKIVIQCAKLLADTSVIPFYPSKFVLITDILDMFGRIVFERLVSKSVNPVAGVPAALPENFSPDQVPETAKETCRNWFFKIASIRELLPRLYVEVAILKCYRFLSVDEACLSLSRLMMMARGVGDPLVSSYLRCYITRVGMMVEPTHTSYLLPALDDFMTVFRHIGDSAVIQRVLASQKLDRLRYLSLYTPACDWLVACVANNASDEILDKVLARCFEGHNNSAQLLNSIISSFRHDYISSRALEFARMIQESESSGQSKHLLYRNLGVCVVAVNPPKEQQLQLLNDVWRVVTKFTDASNYISCAEVWIGYVVSLFGKRELNTMLGDVIRHMTPDRAYEEHYPSLQAIISSILPRQADLTLLFSLDKFMPFIDMFQKESVKVDVCKEIVSAYISRIEATDSTDDPIVINVLMFLCRTMHDSVNALSLDDEVRAIGNLIDSFISRVSYGRDLEKQLSFYVECRAAYSNIDPVLQLLVHKVNRLAMEAKSIVGKHTRKTAAFVRACAAYSFITIPSLNGVFHKLSLYLVSGQVALVNECISQAEAFFKAAIALIPSVPRYLDFDGKVRGTEPFLVDFLSNFTSMLLVMPDPPDQPPLYLIRGLLNILQDYPWDPAADHKLIVFIEMLVALSAVRQDELPYHVLRIDSNDSLYGSDKKFINELEQLSIALLQQVTSHIEALGAVAEKRKRAAVLCMDLLNRLIGHADLTRNEVQQCCQKLWSLAMEYKADRRQLSSCYNYLSARAKRADGRGHKDLLKLISDNGR